MTEKTKRALPLAHTLGLSAAAAGAAIFGHARAMDYVTLTATAPQRLSYAYLAVFIGVFAMGYAGAKFALRHKKGLGVKGVAPVAARAIIIAFCAALPLLWLLRDGKSTVSLQKLIDAAPVTAEKTIEKGYAKDDRDELDALIGREGTP
ncbi:MAG: hypothetical protein OXT65_02615 [Alphaproteobacteria bacterium]|nr:hypothetical protein [Alphaproteobacteria bacterium]